MKSARDIALSVLIESFLFEETFDRANFPEVHKDAHVYRHHAEVAGKKVGVYLSHYGNKPRHYEANFTVNDSFGHGKDAHPHEGHAILHHVHRVMNSFVKEVKPKSISMSGADNDSHKKEQKQKVYTRFADKLAKTHGGTARHESGTSHIENL